MPTLAPITTADVDAFTRLTESVGWTFSREQADMFLSAGSYVGHWKSHQLISSAALFQYGPSLASLGHVIVHPHEQRQGLGRAVVQHCLSEADSMGAPVSLVATAQGYPVYERIGFHTVDTVHRLLIDRSMAPARRDVEGVSPFEQGDLRDVVAMDAWAFGADRGALYAVFAQHIAFGLVVRDDVGQLTGFGMAMRKGDQLVVGPLVAKHELIALQLVASFATSWSGPIRMDVPGEQVMLLKELHAMGFEETLLSPLMVYPGSVLPGARGQLYALMDPAWG